MTVGELIDLLQQLSPDAPVQVDAGDVGIWTTFNVELDEGFGVVVIVPTDMPEPDSADMYGRKGT